MKNNWIIIIFFFIANVQANILLEKPNPLSTDEIEQLAQNWHTQFTWNWGKGSSCTFSYEKEKAGFAVKLLNIPIYFHHYRLLPTIDEIKNMYMVFQNYYFAQPLHTTTAPKTISLNQLITLLNKHTFILYTGAGISAASNVATMADLEKSLAISEGKKHFLKTIWQNPQKIIQAFATFCRSAIYGKPTNAHFALKEITEKRSIAIITENVDLLQQRTGIEPIHTCSPTLHALSTISLQEIDIIVCIGLSCDDHGFLAWYKQNNPNGILIAINRKTPDYLSKNDYICMEDLQKILLLIAQSLESLKN